MGRFDQNFKSHKAHEGIRPPLRVGQLEKLLEARQDKSMLTDFLIKLLDLVLTYNILEPDSQLYQQLIGVSMTLMKIFTSSWRKSLPSIPLKLTPHQFPLCSVTVQCDS